MSHSARPIAHGSPHQLALSGTLDTQVPARHSLPAIAAALAQGVAKGYAVVSLPKLNHLLQTSRTGASEEFANIEETIAQWP